MVFIHDSAENSTVYPGERTMRIVIISADMEWDDLNSKWLLTINYEQVV